MKRTKTGKTGREYNYTIIGLLHVITNKKSGKVVLSTTNNVRAESKWMSL